MKVHAMLIVLAVLVSCHSHRKHLKDDQGEVTAEETAESTEEEAVERFVGVVHTSETGCLVTIEMTAGDKTILCYPVNIEDKYKVEDMVLKFAYTESRAQQPEGCDADMVISISDVAIMRTSDN